LKRRGEEDLLGKASRNFLLFLNLSSPSGAGDGWEVGEKGVKAFSYFLPK